MTTLCRTQPTVCTSNSGGSRTKLYPTTDRRKSGSIVIQPHSDDACFSLGAAIKLHRILHPVTIVTIFTQSSFPIIEHRSIATTTANRKSEDRTFARWADCEIKFLNFRDAFDRNLYGTLERVFDPNARVSKARCKQILASLQSKFHSLAHHDLYLPAGIGNHIDHRSAAFLGQIVDARRIFYYADQPYSISSPHCSPRNQTQRPRIVLIKKDDITEKLKLEAVNIYASQPAKNIMSASLKHAPLGSDLEWVWGP